MQTPYDPPTGPLSILHEDRELVAVEKPAGLLSVPGRGADLSDCLLARVQLAFPDALLVHRLDRDTSGVMVFALTAHAQRHLSMQFETRITKKTYVARVAGELVEKSGEIDLPLIVDWPNRPRQMVCHETGKPAVTEWKVIKTGGGETRLRLTPKTGRSHQLRVHCLSIGHPILGDPLYATYEGVVRASGAEMVPVPLRPEHGFRMQAEDIAERITPRSRAILLTSPHNPTGAILTAADIEAIGALAIKHDLWIISDEVYEYLVFDGSTFVSPLSNPAIADRVIAVSSISKSHAAPGFRSGWCVASTAFCDALLPVSETMLFGNQPFIADMTEQAVREGSPVAEGMRTRYAARSVKLNERLSQETGLTVHQPEAGMFAMINVACTGLDGQTYAEDLLENGGVAVMPGVSFGTTMTDWVRVALTIDDTQFDRAIQRIISHANTLQRNVA
mgnify:CR=1 FL=1